jgi:SH3-like domain-containing protein
MIMKRFLFLWAMALFAGSLVFAQADRNTRYVAVQTVAVKDSTGFFAKDLGTLSLGDAVRLIQDNGKWSQIQTGNITGWVASTSLSARRIVASSSAVIANEVALAGKGFTPDMEREYRKNGLDYSLVDFMEEITVPINDLLRFITEGHLSTGE